MPMVATVPNTIEHHVPSMLLPSRRPPRRRTTVSGLPLYLPQRLPSIHNKTKLVRKRLEATAERLHEPVGVDLLILYLIPDLN